MILVQFDKDKKVIAQRNDDNIIITEWTDLSNHPDGPNFMGRTQLPDGSFTPEPSPPPKTRRQELKEKEIWTVADRNEAIKILL